MSQQKNLAVLTENQKTRESDRKKRTVDSQNPEPGQTPNEEEIHPEKRVCCSGRDEQPGARYRERYRDQSETREKFPES